LAAISQEIQEVGGYVTPGGADEPNAAPRSASDLTERLARFEEWMEVALIAREARTFPVLFNFARYFRPWKPDKKSWAAFRALLIRLLSPAAFAIVGLSLVGAFVAVYTALLLYRQNEKLDALRATY
jgi:hypothetical protein